MYSPFRFARTFLLLALIILFPSTLLAQDATPPNHPLFTGPVHEVPTSFFDQEHVRLAIRFEQKTGQIYGTAKIRIRPLAGAPDTLSLHANNLEIYSIQLGILDSLKQSASYSDSESGKLLIDLDSLQLQDAPIELQITYLANPETGLYFHTDSNSPAGMHIWTDGVLSNTSHWLPLLAMPADLFTSEIIATVPPNVSVLSNGRLTEKFETADGMWLYHYVQDQPHSPEDIGLFTGKLNVDSTYTVLKNGFALPTYYWTTNGLTEDIKASLEDIPKMLTFYSEYLGYTYPWPSYSVVVLDDIFTQDKSLTGLTILNKSIIKDEKARSDSMEPYRLGKLIAQQWYGHLVNPDFEADVWFTESLSSYLSLLYIKETYGDVPFYIQLHNRAAAYFGEANIYQRPLVWNQWDHPLQLIDQHAYGKGVWVFHSIHTILGDNEFASFLQFLTKESAFSITNSDRLLQLFAEYTNQDQDDFFDQWIYSAGHPSIEVKYRYDLVSESLYVAIDQVQSGYLVPASFNMELLVETYSLAGPESFTVDLSSENQLIALKSSMKPRYVIPDSRNPYLMDLRVEQDASSWITQLRYASHPISQLHAIEALEDHIEDPALLIGLQSALRSKPAPAVRAGIVSLIAKLPHSDASRQTLINAFEDESPIVQKAVLEALSQFDDTSELTIIAMDAAQSSPSYVVQSEAVKTLAKIQGKDALGLLQSALITPSHNDIIRRKALESLFLVEMSTQDRVAIASEYTSSTYSPEARLAAIDVLKTLASYDNRRSRRILQGLLDDEVFEVKDTLLDIFMELGNEEDTEVLESFMENERDMRLYYKAQQVLKAISTRLESGTSP